MKRLTWVELTALGILALLALNIAARYGAMAGLLALLVLLLAGRCFITDHVIDEATFDLRLERDIAQAQRDQAVQARMRDALRSGRWPE